MNFSFAVDIITHRSVTVDSINTAQLRRIFTMRQQRWGDNKPIVVFVLPSQDPLHIKFSTQVLKIFPYKLDRIWNKLTFSGLGVAPRVVKSQQELIQLVSATPGAVGYAEKVNKDKDVNVVTMAK
ncbi:hypothetical protein tinsulaeT_23050 [Thalassotalea insulae]|uniref:PBP domain-containing protein n=1 Tax=Thalassotalea insulae TaxID=2056778 RepID=A0ABQ6GW77_9GAMM|nr:hypothetical protein [Thalassotalea insulae]GLX78965.1 hypothetical protein tinsulaeT_23050 [Thalassotalea insulae]